MKKALIGLATMMFALAGLTSAHGQAPQPSPATSGAGDPSISPQRAFGEVSKIDLSGQLIIKTDAGNTLSVMLDEATEYMLLPPGEKTLEKALKTTLATIGVGDRVYARGRVA